MMLKACCCKVRDIFKRQLWLAALWFVVLFFALPVQTALRIQSQRNWPTELIGTMAFQERISNGLLEVFSTQSIVLVWILMPMAFISAIVFGAYMHKQRQVDFYHSQPLLRRDLLLQHSAAGLLAVLLPYLVNLLLTVVVILIMGIGAYMPWGGLFAGIAVHSLYCLAIFAMAMLAVVLSGNGAVALITGLFLMGVLPALLGLGLIMAQEYYPTFFSSLYQWDVIVRWLSPAAAYACVPINGLPHGIIPVIIFDAAIIALTLHIYNKRGSEAAGQAIAFRPAKPVLKYLLAVLAATCFALVFHSISNVSGNVDFWWYFGAVTGAFLATQITEIVYAFDFRAIKRHLVGWAVFMVVYLVVFTGAMHDVTGFNTRLPDASKVVKAEAYLTGVNRYYYDSWGYHYGYNNLYRDEQEFVQRDERALLSQSVVETPEGIAAVVRIAERLANPTRISDEQREFWRQQGKDYLLAYIGDDHSWEGIPVRANQTGMRVVYTMADGSTMARDYRQNPVAIQFIQDDIRAIYADAGLRGALLEQLDYAGEQYLPESLVIFDAFYDIAPLPQLSAAEREALIMALRADLAQLSVDEQLHNMPIGALSMRLYAGAVDYDEMTPEKNSRPCRAQRWPIYASFTHTLGFLAELSYNAALWQPDLAAVRTVRLINNYYYGEDQKMQEMFRSSSAPYATYTVSIATVQAEKRGEPTLITDPAEMTRLIRESYPSEAVDLNCFIDIDPVMELEVEYEGMGGQTFFQRRVFAY